MREMINFSAHVVAQFDNNYDNIKDFNGLLLDASHGVYSQYTKEETNTIIRKQFDKILGINFKEASAMKRRQAWREHGKEIASLVEDVLVDKMTSGWNAGNARFMEYVEQVNIADGDVNEFYVEDNSLLQVSKFAGNHHDIVRQAIKPGKSYRVETSWYVVKCYADYEALQLGKVDFAEMVNRMYASIEANRYDALYTAFMSMDESLPTDMVCKTPVADTTIDTIVEAIEAVKAATGKEVLLVGSRVAIQKLQKTVSYNMFSNEMKNEMNQNGILGNWEGYECLGLSRVNKVGTRTNALDNSKIFILPVDSEFKPVKLINEGDVMYTEAGMDGSTMDMTSTVDIRYKEGVGVVVNELFGEIKITA